MKVIGVIVTYNSNFEKLSAIFNVLKRDADLLVSDNSTSVEHSQKIKALCDENNVHYISMNGNVGIARAQNEGIKAALDMSFEDILLLDDDSLPHADMIDVLFRTRESTAARVNKLPVVCANPCDSEGHSVAKYGKKIADSVYICRDITSSGTLINKKHFDIVGLHEEKLFIDCVDFEWGWRAKSKDIFIILSQEAILSHQLGDGKINVINARSGSPIRHYYQFRNILYMCTRNYTPFSWKASQAFKLIIKYFILIPCCFDNKITRFKFASKGIKDFLLGRYGSIN